MGWIATILRNIEAKAGVDLFAMPGETKNRLPSPSRPVASAAIPHILSHLLYGVLLANLLLTKKADLYTAYSYKHVGNFSLLANCIF